MPARATSSGTISFGLVSIPVKVYPATRTKTIRFNWLHGKDRSRVKQQYVSASTGDKVERDELVKGYEYARDQYVVMTDEELKSIESKSDRTIEIEEFVPIENVDPIYFEKSNLLGPDKGGAKAYRLLSEAMTLMGKVAVGRFSTRGRQQLVLLRPLHGGLVLHGLFHADEVRSFDDIELGDEVELKKTEVDLATQLIEQLSTPKFEPDKFEDEYRHAVLEAVERKVAGEEVVAVSRAEPQDQIIDLVAALKKTLAEKKQGAPAAARARKPAKAKGKGDKKAPAKRKAASR